MQQAMLGFQRAQQVSAERQRSVVEGVKHALDEDESCVATPLSRCYAITYRHSHALQAGCGPYADASTAAADSVAAATIVTA